MNDPTRPAPEYFGPEDRPLLGWLQRPPRPQGLGVLLCPPLGHELIHSHLTLRALAQAIAGRGLPVLRLDYAGTGDSADPPQDGAPGGACPAWLASIDAAIAHLQARGGVQRVALLAVRSGTLLAATVAARHPDVAALVALAPVCSGRRLLREWRALSASAALASTRGDGALEVAGFTFDALTCAAVEAIELGELRWPAALAVSVIDRDDLPAAERWIAQLQQAGLAVQHDRHSGLAAMLDEPQRHVVPVDAVQACADWLARLGPAPPAHGQARAAMPAPAPARESAAMGGGVRESVLRIGRHKDRRAVELMGILAEPTSDAQAEPGPVVLLPNTGPVHHIGGHRLYVDLARGLAGRGCRVLRFDLSGLGDSPARPGEAPGAIYGPRAVDDVAQAVAEARQRWPGQEIVLLGLCAGAYHALKSAVAGSRVARAVIVNPLVYHWKDGMTLEAAEGALQAVYYRSKWRRLESWKRLASGRSDLRLLAQVVGRRLADLAGALRARPHPATTTVAAPRDDLAQELEQAAGFGTRLDFVFSQDEPGWPMLQQQAAAAVRRLRGLGLLSVQHLARADHTFSTEDARRRLTACVVGLLWPHAVEPQAPADLAVALASLDMTRQGS